MNNPALREVRPYSVNESYRVYRKQKLVAQGTAVELQLFFNERAHILKRKLREWERLPDDVQLQNKYQIESEASYQQEIQAELEHLLELEQEEASEFEWPDTMLEYELMFHPGDERLEYQLRHSKSKHHRYYRKFLVEKWKQEQREISNELADVIAEVDEQLPALEMSAALRQQKRHPVPKRADKYRNRLTPIEINHLEQKKKQRMRQRAAMQKKFYK